ncbi:MULTISPECIES: barstar family protein [Pantoea]|uniref:barstar family protein n=1 Tax=Pantoea TaxID=53335 RepID=UPI001CC1C24F
MILEGRDIHTESDLHRILAEMMDLDPCYGRNLDALWDCLNTDIERPTRITWCHSGLSKKAWRAI